MCLSAITWGGFSNIYIFWTYEDSESLFDEPYSRLMEEAIFKLPAEGETPEAWARRPLYARENRFWTAVYVVKSVEGLEESEEKRVLGEQVQRIKGVYAELWKTYKSLPRPPGSGRPDE